MQEGVDRQGRSRQTDRPRRTVSRKRRERSRRKLGTQPPQRFDPGPGGQVGAMKRVSRRSPFSELAGSACSDSGSLDNEGDRMQIEGDVEEQK